MFFRAILFSIIFSLSLSANAIVFNGTVAKPEKPTKYSRAVLNLVMTIMNKCYKGPQTKGDKLAHCVISLLKKFTPNPQRYKLRLTGDCPGKVDLILYNVRGNIINCKLTLDQKVNVNRCVGYKIPPLTNGQDDSIFPPKVIIQQ